MSKRELETLGKMGSRLSLRFKTAVDGSDEPVALLLWSLREIYGRARKRLRRANTALSERIIARWII